jgi:hypothetical protein
MTLSALIVVATCTITLLTDMCLPVTFLVAHGAEVRSFLWGEVSTHVDGPIA